MSWKRRRSFLEAQKRLENNDYEGAEALYSSLILEEPGLVEALLHRAYTRMRSQKMADAHADAIRCTELRPESGVMFMLKGEIELEQNDFINAYTSLKKACELEADNGRAFFHLGRACLKLKKTQEAADYFEVALQFERDYVNAQWMAHSLA